MPDLRCTVIPVLRTAAILTVSVGSTVIAAGPDLNLDGHVGVDDLLEVIEHWQ